MRVGAENGEEKVKIGTFFPQAGQREYSLFLGKLLMKVAFGADLVTA